MRDVNGQMHWSFNNAADFKLNAVSSPAWNEVCNAMTLRRTARIEPSRATKATIRALAAAPAMAVDAFGTWARIAEDAPGRIAASGAGEGPRVIFDAGEGREVLDFDSSPDGDLVVIWRDLPNGRPHVTWADTLARFDPIPLEVTGFAPTRVTIAPDRSAIWLIDTGRQLFARVEGVPVPAPISALDRAETGFEADPLAAVMPRVDLLGQIGSGGRGILDAAALNDGRLAVLHEGDGRDGVNQVDWIDADGTVTRSFLRQVTRAFSIRPHGGDRVVVVSPGWSEARVYSAPPPDIRHGDLQADAPRIPLTGWTGGRLCNGGTPTARYPVAGRDGVRPWANLAALSKTAYLPAGTAFVEVDTDTDGFVWHRLYIEADIPKGTFIRIVTVASDGPAVDGPMRATAHGYVFGSSQRFQDDARGVWVDMPSEHPHGRNHLPDGSTRQRDRRGLWTCLLQSRRGGSTRLKGRHLRVFVFLAGDGAATPRLHALRVWGPRFSYRDRYLPELYQIDQGPGAEGSDFLDRFLCLFESVLTPLEGQIAETWRGASAATAPKESLPWLAGWLGLTPDSALGEAGMRRVIAGAAEQSLWHGTLRGLETALDLATDGGVAEGRIVVVENFRLKRTFATILGADFDDRFDPLTRGTRGNANSVLGPAFFLGHEDQKALFALLRPDILEHDLTDPSERAAARAQLDDMTDDTAFRVTVLVHDGTDARQRGLVQNVLNREVPAHVRADVFDAPQSLLLGLTALLGVETRLGPDIEIEPFTLNQTRMGQSQLRGLPSLDPRLEP